MLFNLIKLDNSKSSLENDADSNIASFHAIKMRETLPILKTRDTVNSNR